MAERIGEHPGNYRHPSTPVKGEKAATGSPVRFQNLPPLLAPLIGREEQEQAIRALLLKPAVQLLTLTGTGGISKTRLAQQVATDLIEVFTHGVCLVQLAPLSDADLVVPTISQTLGLRDVEERSLFSSLKAFLRDKHLLVLLDNFEQVLEAAPALVELLLACPSIKILVTSRAVLHVEGEYEFAVPPLSLPDPLHLPAHEELLHYAAVALFVQRAQAAASKRDYMLTRTLAAQSLELARAVRDTGSLILCLEELVDVGAGQGEPAWAARLWGAAEHYREASHAMLPLVERLGRARRIEQAKHLLGEQIFAEKWAEGRTMMAEQAIAASPTRDRTSKPQRTAQPLLDPLSERELEVLQLVAGGASNQEIAIALVLTPGTVKLHVSHILSKLGVNSRTRAIIRARDLGLLTEEHTLS